jgi:hypothetical protein
VGCFLWQIASPGKRTPLIFIFDTEAALVLKKSKLYNFQVRVLEESTALDA